MHSGKRRNIINFRFNGEIKKIGFDNGKSLNEIKRKVIESFNLTNIDQGKLQFRIGDEFFQDNVRSDEMFNKSQNKNVEVVISNNSIQYFIISNTTSIRKYYSVNETIGDWRKEIATKYNINNEKDIIFKFQSEYQYNDDSKISEIKPKEGAAISIFIKEFIQFECEYEEQNKYAKCNDIISVQSTFEYIAQKIVDINTRKFSINQVIIFSDTNKPLNHSSSLLLHFAPNKVPNPLKLYYRIDKSIQESFYVKLLSKSINEQYKISAKEYDQNQVHKIQKYISNKFHVESDKVILIQNNHILAPNSAVGRNEIEVKIRSETEVRFVFNNKTIEKKYDSNISMRVCCSYFCAELTEPEISKNMKIYCQNKELIQMEKDLQIFYLMFHLKINNEVFKLISTNTQRIKIKTFSKNEVIAYKFAVDDTFQDLRDELAIVYKICPECLIMKNQNEQEEVSDKTKLNIYQQKIIDVCKGEPRFPFDKSAISGKENDIFFIRMSAKKTIKDLQDFIIEKVFNNELIYQNLKIKYFKPNEGKRGDVHANNKLDQYIGKGMFVLNILFTINLAIEFSNNESINIEFKSLSEATCDKALLESSKILPLEKRILILKKNGNPMKAWEMIQFDREFEYSIALCPQYSEKEKYNIKLWFSFVGNEKQIITKYWSKSDGVSKACEDIANDYKIEYKQNVLLYYQGEECQNCQLLGDFDSSKPFDAYYKIDFSQVKNLEYNFKVQEPDFEIITFPGKLPITDKTKISEIREKFSEHYKTSKKSITLQFRDIELGDDDTFGNLKIPPRNELLVIVRSILPKFIFEPTKPIFINPARFEIHKTVMDVLDYIYKFINSNKSIERTFNVEVYKNNSLLDRNQHLDTFYDVKSKEEKFIINFEIKVNYQIEINTNSPLIINLDSQINAFEALNLITKEIPSIQNKSPYLQYGDSQMQPNELLISRKYDENAKIYLFIEIEIKFGEQTEKRFFKLVTPMEQVKSTIEVMYSIQAKLEIKNIEVNYQKYIFDYVDDDPLIIKVINIQKQPKSDPLKHIQTPIIPKINEKQINENENTCSPEIANAEKKIVKKSHILPNGNRIYRFQEPGEEIFECEFKPDATVLDAIEFVAETKDVDDENVTLMFAGKTLRNESLLSSLMIPARGKIIVYIKSLEEILLTTAANLIITVPKTPIELLQEQVKNASQIEIQYALFKFNNDVGEAQNYILTYQKDDDKLIEEEEMILGEITPKMIKKIKQQMLIKIDTCDIARLFIMNGKDVQKTIEAGREFR